MAASPTPQSAARRTDEGAPQIPPLSRRDELIPVLTTWLAAAALTVGYVTLGHIIDALRTSSPIGPWPITILTSVVLVIGAASYLSSRTALHAIGPREADRRDTLLHQLFRLGVPFRTDGRSGRFVSVATDGVERAAFYEATFRAPMLASVTVPFVALLVLGVSIDWFIALILALTVPLIPLTVRVFQLAFRKVSTQYRAESRRFAGEFLDAIQGLPTATAFNRAEAIGVRLADAAERIRRQVMRLLAGNQIVILVVDAAFSLAMVTLAAGLAMVRLRDGVITPGQAVAVVLTATVLLEPLDKIGQFFYVAMGGRAAAQETASLLAASPAVPDPATSATSALTATTALPDPPLTAPERVAPAIEFDRVGFAYRDGPEVLREVSFALDSGRRMALIGPSGSGKTTLTSLLLAHLRPTTGTVRVQGRDLSTVPATWARAQFATVAQSTYLFTGTLADNLRLADPDATEARLWEVLAEANLADHVRSLPDGLNTPVGERGWSLSGGQAQRMAVARALLTDAPVLLLDEPTSQVDAHSERALVAALDRAARGRTVLVIAHRLSTVRDVDDVLVLAGGAIVERGTPDQLREVDSYYARAIDLSEGR